MRLLFLIPDLRQDRLARLWVEWQHRLLRSRFAEHRILWTDQVFGGTLAIMRQCALARSLGADAIMATRSGRDTYGDLGVEHLPFAAWAKRRPDDVCVVPDIYSALADDVVGPVIVYQQNPNLVRPDFDHRRPNVRLWTCSPLMSDCCRRILPGNEPTCVPMIIDPGAFPFRPAGEHQAGRLAALPRKGAMEFIQSAFGRYRELGGRYWELDLIDGLPFHQYAKRFCQAEAFLPATDVEGFALPGLEAMAAGVAVAGKNARGASAYMRDDDNALIANTVEEAAAALLRLEDPQLRQRLTQSGYAYVQQFFREAEPTRFWQQQLVELGLV